MFELANILAILAVGRKPQWVQQTPAAKYTGAPALDSAGLTLQDTPTTIVDLLLRREAHRRTLHVTMTTLDAGATYTVTINGTAITFATPSNEDALIVGLQAAITADATVGQAAGTPIVDSNMLDSLGVLTLGTVAGGNPAVTLVVFGEAEAHYTAGVASTGTGKINADADADAATLRVWLKPKVGGAVTPASWRVVNGGASYSIDFRGFVDRFNTGGMSRMYTELFGVSGTGDVPTANGTITYFTALLIGPTIDEVKT